MAKRRRKPVEPAKAAPPPAPITGLVVVLIVVVIAGGALAGYAYTEYVADDSSTGSSGGDSTSGGTDASGTGTSGSSTGDDASSSGSSDGTGDSGTTGDAGTSGSSATGDTSIDYAPDFTLVTTKGDLFTLSDYRGEIVLLDFMATWCPPCVEEMKEIRQIQSSYPDVVILSVDVDTTESSSKLDQFMKDNSATWPAAVDIAGAGDMYGVQYIPKLVLIHPRGDIAFEHTGHIEYKEIAKEIAAIG